MHGQLTQKGKEARKGKTGQCLHEPEVRKVKISLLIQIFSEKL